MDWNLKKIKLLIENQVEESLHLEYKRALVIGNSDGKKRDLSKDVTAFANSDGGTLIIGVKEYDDKSKSHLPESLDGLDRIKYPREWIEQIITENISPRINGLVIIPIEIEDGSVIYIVEIPKSKTAHQAKDFRYYKRHNFRSTPMLDYEVKDVINRNTTPRLKLEIILEYYRGGLWLSGGETLSEANEMLKNKEKLEFKLKPTLRNVGNKVARFVKCDILIPSDILVENTYSFREQRQINGKDFILFERDNGLQDIVDQEQGKYGSTVYKYGPKRYDPILPGRILSLEEIYLTYKKNDLSSRLKWVIFADDASQVEQAVKLQEILIAQKKK